MSITAASYDGLQPGQTDQASGLINMARNVGGSMGVCLAQNVLARREQFHQSRLTENTDPSNPAYQDTLRSVTDVMATQGDPASAQSRAVGWISEQVATQAAHWSYIDVFWSLGLVATAIVLLALSLRRVAAGRPPAGAH